MKLIILIAIACIIISVAILCINNYESFSRTDYYSALDMIDNRDDFNDYLEYRLGSYHLDKMKVSYESRRKIIEDYITGINGMKAIAHSKQYVLNKTPLYGKYMKIYGGNINKIIECF